VNVGKIVACALLMAGCVGVGLAAAYAEESKAAYLASFSHLTAYLIDSLGPLSLTVPQALERYEALYRGKPAAFFAHEVLVLFEEDPRPPPQAIWEVAMEKFTASYPAPRLSEEEEAVLRLPAACLTALSLQELERTLRTAERAQGECTGKARDSAQVKGRLYRVLGVLAGVMACIWIA